MESVIFSGDSFSEYYLSHVMWGDSRLKPYLGIDSFEQSFKKASIAVRRAQRDLRARQQSRSTRTLLLEPLSGLLGWEIGSDAKVQTAEGAEDAGTALCIDGRTVARVVAIPPDAPLDQPPIGLHRRFSPSLSIVRVLEESRLTWGLLLNAYELRLVRRAEGFVSSYIGFDLSSIAEGSEIGLNAWKLLWGLLRAEALQAEPIVLERAVEQGREHQEGVGKALGQQVQDAVVAFLQGLVSHPDNREKIAEPGFNLQQFYVESLRVLYRLLFTIYAESRYLLPVDIPAYRDGYSVLRLARRATSPETDPRNHPTDSGRYFEHSLRALFALVRQGADLGPEGIIPNYDGALFDPARTEFVESLTWGDETVAKVLEKLTLVESGHGLMRLSYRELDVEQLGSLYENLLERNPHMAEERLYRILLDKQELVLNRLERDQLVERRGETVHAEVEQEEDDEDHDSEPEPEEDDTELETPEDVPVQNKPLRLLGEIEPGSVYLKAGTGRKQTGSFYTSRPLVEFLVRRTIDPLAEGKTPEEILRLRVLDPAMGSGHFLVGACRRLAEHLLAAYREAIDGILEDQADLPLHDAFLDAGVHPEIARNWENEEKALAACRLIIAGNCIYGVDKNPLAVDLARVSLWLATAASDHPLTFLDHRLRCGDSLLGLPLYMGDGEEPEVHLLQPVSLKKTGGKKKKGEFPKGSLLEGVQMKEVLYASTRQLRERMRRALSHLRLISQLTDEHPGDFTGQRAAFEAMQGELRLFWDLHSIRIGQQFLATESLAEVTIIDRWLSEISEAGFLSEEAWNIAKPYLERGQEFGAFCWQLAFPEVFYDKEGQLRDDCGFDVVIGNPPWDKIKPNERECFSEFDPTVWDLQGQARKRLIDQLISENPDAKQAWEKHENEMKSLSKYLLDGGIYHHQVATVEGKKTGGDPDIFKFFTERAYQLLRDGGNAGIIVPLGIQGSLGTTGLRRLLLDQCRLQALVKLDNERLIFPGVFHGQKFDLVVFTKGGSTEDFSAAFFGWEPAEVIIHLEDDARHTRLDAGLYRELAPEQYTFAELHNQHEVELVRRIYRDYPRLDENLEHSLNIDFTSELHMTNNSYLFRDAARLKVFGSTLHSRLPSTAVAARDVPFEDDEGGEYWTTPPREWFESQGSRYLEAERWVDSKRRPHLPGNIPIDKVKYKLNGFILSEEKDSARALPVRPDEKYIPLYEGRMVHQFDHCQKGYVSGSGRRAKWVELGWDEKRMVPHYYVSDSDFQNVRADRRKHRAGFCEVTGQTNERSVLVTMIPPIAICGHKVPTASADNLSEELLFCAFGNSFVVDWLFRLRVSNSVSYFMWNATPMPKVSMTNNAVKGMLESCSLLVSTTTEFSAMWKELSGFDPQINNTRSDNCTGVLDITKRARLRAEIDALVAELYKVSVYEYARILSTFPLLDRDQPPLPGDCFIRMTNKGEKIEPRSFITRDLALLTYFELSEQEPPDDIVAFLAAADIDIERQTGPIRNLRVRVEEAMRRGAVAYIPGTKKGYEPSETPYLPPDLPPEVAADRQTVFREYLGDCSDGGDDALIIRGTNIPARTVSDFLLQEGGTFEQVRERYPGLSNQQIAVALRWGQLS